MLVASGLAALVIFCLFLSMVSSPPTGGCSTSPGVRLTRLVQRGACIR